MYDLKQTSFSPPITTKSARLLTSLRTGALLPRALETVRRRQRQSRRRAL
jgi:hypothetical protein